MNEAKPTCGWNEAKPYRPPESEPQVRSSELVSLPVELASDVLEELYELRGERNWWKNEPRCNYQRDYNRLCAEIDALEKLLGRQANDKVSRRADNAHPAAKRTQ